VTVSNLTDARLPSRPVVRTRARLKGQRLRRVAGGPTAPARSVTATQTLRSSLCRYINPNGLDARGCGRHRCGLQPHVRRVRMDGTAAAGGEELRPRSSPAMGANRGPSQPHRPAANRGDSGDA
jgi:hypothetical protein